MKQDRKIFYGRYSLPKIANEKAYNDVWYILNRIEMGGYDLTGHDVVVEISKIPKDERDDR